MVDPIQLLSCITGLQLSRSQPRSQCPFISLIPGPLHGRVTIIIPVYHLVFTLWLLNMPDILLPRWILCRVPRWKTSTRRVNIPDISIAGTEITFTSARTALHG